MLNGKEIHSKMGYTLGAAAVVTGLVDSQRYARALQIEPWERGPYFRKTFNISLVYAGFAQRFSLDQAKGAGHAAFLTCAYDVVTDWGKQRSLQASFARSMHALASPELANMALDLLDRDTKGALLDDGLERGVVTLEFILGMMNIREAFGRKCDNFKQLGQGLQIVDDVIDWENDNLKGDQNCLTNTNLRSTYLGRILEDFDDLTLKTLFPYGPIPIYVIKRTQPKARDMLAHPEKYFR